VKRDGDLIRAIDLETVSGAAKRLGVHRTRVYQMIDGGMLDYYQYGDRRMVSKRDIDKMLMNGWKGKRNLVPKREVG
jgi:excisionase family DNA binding protein